MAESGAGRESKKAKNNVHFLMRLQHVEGLLITISIFYFGYFYLQPFITPPNTNDVGAKLRFVLGCSVVPSLVFLLSIAAVLAKRRKLEISNPLAGREHLLELEHRFSQNTLEQLTVFLVSTVVLATYLEGDEMKLVPLNALVFTVGRILFRVGYGVHPKYRGVGGVVRLLCTVYHSRPLRVHDLHTRNYVWTWGRGVYNSSHSEHFQRRTLANFILLRIPNIHINK